MTNEDIPADRRRHRRFAVSKSISFIADAQEYEGAVRNISAGGAAVETDASVEEGRLVELAIEDLRQLAGRVARAFDNGLAVEFDISPEEQERLIAEIMQVPDIHKKEDD